MIGDSLMIGDSSVTNVSDINGQSALKKAYEMPNQIVPERS